MFAIMQIEYSIRGLAREIRVHWNLCAARQTRNSADLLAAPSPLAPSRRPPETIRIVRYSDNIYSKNTFLLRHLAHDKGTSLSILATLTTPLTHNGF